MLLAPFPNSQHIFIIFTLLVIILNNVDLNGPDLSDGGNILVQINVMLHLQH